MSTKHEIQQLRTAEQKLGVVGVDLEGQPSFARWSTRNEEAHRLPSNLDPRPRGKRRGRENHSIYSIFLALFTCRYPPFERPSEKMSRKYALIRNGHGHNYGR